MSRDAKHAETGAREAATGSTALATKTKPAPDTDAPKNADDEPAADPLSWLPLSGGAKKAAEWISVILAIWLLLNAVGMIGAGFKMAAGDQAKELFSFAENPFVGLAVGILATAIMQLSLIHI